MKGQIPLRLPVLAGVAWLAVAAFLLTDAPIWLLLLPPVAVAVLAAIGKMPYRVGYRIACGWMLLAAAAVVQVDYHNAAANLVGAGTKESSFEALGNPRRAGDEFQVWIKLLGSEYDSVAPVGLLRVEDPLMANAQYRGMLTFSPVESSADRETFWATAKGPISLLSPGDELGGFFASLRVEFLESVSGVSPDARALVAGLAIGERSMLSESLENQMRTLSLSHLVAVSGANLAIVAGGVYLLLSTLGVGRATRGLLAGLVIIAYVALVGPEPSVLRAAVMALAVILGQQLGRGNQSTNALALSVLLLVHFDPYLALDFGFALSVLATLGLLVLAPTLYQRLTPSLPRGFAAALAVALAAQLYTLPILLMLENRLPTMAVVANLLAEPVVAPVTVLGIVGVIVTPVLPPLTTALTWIASLGTGWIEWVAKNLSELPGVTVSWLPAPASILFSLLILAATTAWVRTWNRRWLTATAMLLAISLGWSGTNHIRATVWPLHSWQIIACDVGQGDALLVRSQGRVMLIDVGRESELLLDCLKQAAVTRVDLLILTHYDADHVAALPALLSASDVGLALVSGYPDDRPLAQLAREALEENGVRTVAGQAGQSLMLGEARVSVLQPSLTAREASDSNDASLVVSATLPNFALLALGDLGEPGQARLLTSQRAHLRELAAAQLVLKVAHHGSADQSKVLTEYLRPEFAIISAGVANSYGHPRPETLAVLAQVGSKVLRTDLSGSIGIAFEPGPQVSLAGKL